MTNGILISLRVQHPLADLAGFCEGLGFVRERIWCAGVAARAAGDTYCTCNFPAEAATYLEEGLRTAVALLRPHADRLVRFARDGGRLSFAVTPEKAVLEGASLDSSLLAELGALQISLDIGDSSP